jgi:predicted extracellular nuclease
MSHRIPHLRRAVAAASAAAIGAGALVLVPSIAQAAPDGSGLVINEVFGGGGNSGAPFQNDFVELYNPTDAQIDLAGLSLEYKSAAGGSGGSLALAGSVAPGGHFLVQMAAGNGAGEPLPTADQVGSATMAAASGRVYLFEGTGQFAATEGDLAGVDGLVDMVGFGTAASYEGAATPTLSNATSASRTEGGDSDNNAEDFEVGAPTPTNAAGESVGETDPGEPGEPVEPGTPIRISEVQGPGSVSPVNGQTVTVRGVVTADYRDGGFNGFTMQDPDGDPTDDSSDAIFIYGNLARAEIGQSVEVTGRVSEYEGITEITPNAVTVLTESLGEVTPITSWAGLETAEGKLAHQSELVQFDEPFTVTDNYDANFYGSFGLAYGENTLRQPTEVADPHDSAAITAVEDANAAAFIMLDDGRSTNFNSNKSTALSYLTPENPVTVGSAVTFNQPFVLDYRYGSWQLEPTLPIVGAGAEHVSFSDVRAQNAVPQEVGGDVTIATFNVLNYFPTTAAEFVESGLGTCTTYNDRNGVPIGANSCNPDGPRGAATPESFDRQEAKIVNAISTSGASIVALEEIENSIHYAKDRDFAVSTLVDALNEAEGEGTWDYVKSPEDIPSDEDVIRNAFIYRPADVQLVGDSRILVDDPAFSNAREPLAQAFAAAGIEEPATDETFLVATNHFKSKGSGADDGTGQGNSNPDRIAQAEALVDFIDDVSSETGVESVFLAGDFNAYTAEDPIVVLTDAGYIDLNDELNDGEPTYNYDGLDGSLDHVLANAAALDLVTGVDVWQINGQEQVGFEYSRYNYNATLLYDESVFRASDHNPIVVGLDLIADETEEPGTEEPGTEEPGTDEPGTEEPGTEEPGTDEPGTDEPGSDEPGTEEPGTDEPGTDEPGTEEPGTEEPGTDEPGTEEPGTDEPGTEKPGTEEPGTEKPGAEKPGTEKPGTEEPGTDEPGKGEGEQTPAPEDGEGEETPAGPQLTTSTDVVAPGTVIEVSGAGFTAGETIRIELHSTPVVLGTTTAREDGSFSAEVTIPETTAPGAHTIVAIGATSGITAAKTITVSEGAQPGDEHPADEDPSSNDDENLSPTGGDSGLGTLAAGTILLAGGAAILFARRRVRA